MKDILKEKSIEDKRIFYKAMLSSYEIGEWLEERAFEALLELLKMHPSADKKIGVGIKEFMVDSDGHGGKCFHLIRQDGTKEDFSYLQCLGTNPYKKTVNKPKSKQPEGSLPVAKATAKTAKITLVLDPASITTVDSIGKKQTIIKIKVEKMVFNATLNSKSYRKTLAAIEEFGIDNCNVILQGSMKEQSIIESAGLAVQPKKIKEDVT